MTVKTNGAEFKRFYDDNEFWPEGTWHEDEDITVGGEIQDGGIDTETLSDDARITIDGGCVFGPQFDENEPSLETYFRRWRKKQTTASFVVECDIAKVESVKSAVMAAGGKVSK